RGRQGVGVSVRAKASLLAAYSHCKPRPYSGNVDIISSQKRRSSYEPANCMWGILLPRRRVHVVAKTRFHSELYNAQAGETAATLQRCIDRAIDKLQAARAEHA